MKKGTQALIVTENGEIALQQRDDKPGIANPGFISMFGGTLEEEDENDFIKGLRRELKEELEINLDDYQYEHLGTYQKTIQQDGEDYEINVYLVHDVPKEKLILKEGKAIKYLSPNENLESLKMTRITLASLTDYRQKS